METVVMTETMPCAPVNLLDAWAFQNTLGTYEKELAAAILIRYSLAADKWVGVNAEILDERISNANYALLKHEQVKELIRDWELKNKLTAGIYGLFHKRPKDPEPLTDPLATPLSTTFLTAGLIGLIREGLAISDGKFIFPTPQLINQVAKRYKKT